MCPKNIKEKTMKRFRKSTALLLAVLMLSGSMYSCSETQNETKETESAPLLNRESESESAVEETVDERLSPSLEILDLEERKFRIYGCPPNEGGDWHVHDMISEELTGEAVNDAIYDRNLFLEDTYKFGIELTESTGNVQQEIVNLVSAGDESYSVCGVTVRTAANLSVDGNTYDLTKLKYIDLSQPYWTPSLNDPLTVEGRLFMASGDISVVPREAIRAFYFNKDLQQNYQFESPYDFVRDGTWTYDQMFSMIETATSDLNGDGKIDKNDRYGIQGQGCLRMVMYQGSGESLVSKNENGSFVMTVENERSINALQKVAELIAQRKDNIYLSGDWQNMLKMFENNQALFYTEVMLHIETMRGYDVDFGIIPTPKYEESQQNYSHWVDNGCNLFYAVPVSLSDPDTSAYMLEAIAAASRYYLTPAYYDVCLKGKYSRDEESSEMLDIIFNTYHLDLGDVYGWGNISGFITSALVDNGNISSTIAALRSMTNKSIKKTLDKFYKNKSWE